MIIEVNNVGLKIGKKEILKSVTISFEKGKIHGLIGRNGSEKTMLMKCICGFIKTTEGSITVDGKQIGKDCDFPKSVGVIIETPGFIPYYNGYKNLKLLADLNRKIGKDAIRECMRQVGLDPDLKIHVRKYSLGMRQRLGLAQAIMENPDILILDEPMNGLDKEGVVDMRNYLQQYREKGKTIIIASHSTEELKRVDEQYKNIISGKEEVNYFFYDEGCIKEKGEEMIWFALPTQVPMGAIIRALTKGKPFNGPKKKGRELLFRAI